MTWNEGYVSDVDYTFGYYQELNPVRISLPFLANGILPPKIEHACELGFGQGVSINILAASQDIKWWGTDFNPNQALHAKNLARASGGKAICSDESFEKFCARTDLPNFDFIGLHGIWSWISDKNREILAEFFDRKLNTGGVVYLGYNALPGWSTFAPIRNLMTEYLTRKNGKHLDQVDEIKHALDFIDTVVAADPKKQAQLKTRLDKLKSQSTNYLAHEYFNKDWHPKYFSELSAQLEPCRLEFACSAHYNDLVDAINLTQEQQDIIKLEKDTVIKETLRNFFTNQQFRRDYWVKGKIRLSSYEQRERILALKFILCRLPNEIELKTNGLLGEANLSEEVYKPIINFFSDYEPHTLGEVLANLKEINFAKLVQAIIILSGNGTLNEVTESRSSATYSLNKLLIERSRVSDDIKFLASNVIGGGIPVSRVEQLILGEYIAGARSEAEIAMNLKDFFIGQNQKIYKGGSIVEDQADILSVLEEKVRVFFTSKLVLFERLGLL